MIDRVLGHYRILEKLGRGGMGEVYKARDMHLDRFVAIKVLHPDKVADPERKARFIQEAKSASALHHPNIVVIHDIGTTDGIDYIAMEHVAGQTLQEALNGKPLPLRDMLRVGIQIADALAKAHQAGIVHRDLKPANVMLAESGDAKLLDFGLAKLTDETPADAQTRTLRGPVTSEGAVMGTAAYMSPEQAEGKRVDRRTDIFSFGLILYEMATGRPAFWAASTASTLAAILRDEPKPIRDLMQDVPPEFERVVTRCLRKEPRRRFQHIDDVAVELNEIADDYESGKFHRAAPVAVQRRSRSWLYAIGLALLLITVATLWSVQRTKEPLVRNGTVFTRLTADPGLTFQPVLSPDAKLVAYSSDRAGDGGLDIWVQQLAGGEPIRLTSDAADDQDPAFSPDGTRIAFSSSREGSGVYVMSALGGAAQRVADGGFRPRFSPDGKWISYQTGDRLAGAGGTSAVYLIPAIGGTPTRLAESLFTVAAAVWSPNSKSLLLFGAEGSFLYQRALDWWIVDLDSRELKKTGLLDALRGRRLAPADATTATQHLMPVVNCWTDDFIVFTAFQGQTSNIWKLPVSASGLDVARPPERLTAGTALESGASVVKLAGRTSMVFASGLDNIDLWSLPLSPDVAKLGAELQRLTRGLGADVRPSVTLDGRTLAYNSNAAGNWDIILRDLVTGAEKLLVSSELDEENPRISSDGQQLAFRIGHTAFTMPAAGGVKRKVTDDCAGLFPWDSQGRSFLCTGVDRLELVNANSGQGTTLMSGTQVTAPRLSWDDRWVTFYHNVPGGYPEIFIAPVSGGIPAPESDSIRVTDGKSWDALPEFSPDGGTLYFQSERDGNRCLWAERLDKGTKRPVGQAFAVQHFHRAGLSLAYVMPGQRALTIARDKIIIAAAERTANVWLAPID